jgi:hypothetical protein
VKPNKNIKDFIKVKIMLGCNIQGGVRNVVPFYHPIEIVTS